MPLPQEVGSEMRLITRRSLLQTAAAATVAGSTAAFAGIEPGRKANIVFIMADDMGYADLSCYGRNGVGTPVIDTLARDGMQFHQAYGNSCVCSPTRVGLITGRYQYRLRVGLEEPLTTSSIGLPAGHPTLPSLLQKQGYDTVLIGKWHMGGPPSFGPLRSGYERFYGIYNGAADYFTHKLSLDKADANDGLFDKDVPAKDIGYMTDLLGERAAKEIERFGKGDRPFFMSLHFTAPHWPWEGPEDSAVSRTLTDIRDRDGGNVATYGQMMRSMDQNVGKVLEALEKSGLADRTIVIFTCDNGGERFSDTWPLIGRKTELLEGGIRVPLLVRWPGVIRPGSRSEQVTLSMDWLPTLLEMAGGAADPRYPADGISILPAFTGSPDIARTLFWRYRANHQSAVRDGNWKYLEIGGNSYLFDLSYDEREQANMKKKHPEKLANLQERFAAWNATMLPYPEESFSEDGKQFATDRY
jgi:arylsulfatase A-like enzyme